MALSDPEGDDNGQNAGVGFKQAAETVVIVTTATAAITGTITSIVYYTLD